MSDNISNKSQAKTVKSGSDTASMHSNMTAKTNRCKLKVCAYCGKVEDTNWSKHFKKFADFHGGIIEKKEWIEGELL
jgi:hypothetical protein